MDKSKELCMMYIACLATISTYRVQKPLPQIRGQGESEKGCNRFGKNASCFHRRSAKPMLRNTVRAHGIQSCWGPRGTKSMIESGKPTSKLNFVLHTVK